MGSQISKLEEQFDIDLGACCQSRTDLRKQRILLNLNNDLQNHKSIEFVQQIPNEVDRFKYLFPFYRTNISVFEYKLNELIQSQLESKHYDTEIVTCLDLEKEFATTPSWKDLWPKVENLIRTPEFKEIAYLDRIEQDTTENLINITSKLEFGVMGLLWCQGTQDEKADFMYNLTCPVNEDVKVWSENNFKIIFKKLFFYSIDLPELYAGQFFEFGEIENEKSSLKEISEAKDKMIEK